MNVFPENEEANSRYQEAWDRLVLLLISQPREGWESEFEEITRREIERLRLPIEDDEGGD